MEQQPPSSGKRADVGYKRPPREHQFKKGHKPAPRKQKEKNAAALKPSELLWRILQEERRVTIGNQVRWMSTLQLLIRRAFEISDKGNPSIRRIALDLLMRTDTPGEEDEALVRHFVNGIEVPNW